MAGKKKARKTTRAGGGGDDLLRIAQEQQEKLQKEREEMIATKRRAEEEEKEEEEAGANEVKDETLECEPKPEPGVQSEIQPKKLSPVKAEPKVEGSADSGKVPITEPTVVEQEEEKVLKPEELVPVNAEKSTGGAEEEEPVQEKRKRVRTGPLVPETVVGEISFWLLSILFWITTCLVDTLHSQQTVRLYVSVFFRPSCLLHQWSVGCNCYHWH